MNLKIKCLREKLRGLDLQGMVITNTNNIRYLTGIEAEGVLLITRKENLYITDGRYIEHANSILTIDDEIIVCNNKDLTFEDYENFFIFCENVGFEEYDLTYAQYKEFKHKYQINNFEETELMIEKQRMIKDDDEITKLQKACNITDDCFDYLKSFIKIGQTEKEIALEIEKYFKTHGADGISFSPIVASGENTSMPHAIPTDRKIKLGDVLTIDMGCKYQGYCSDMTRTVFVGEVPAYVKPIYDLVLAQQIKVAEELKDGANLKIIIKGLESDFKLNGFDLVHSLGHGIGLDIHELPIMSNKVDFVLKDKMVITNEPGIYIIGKFGIRIEDSILITKYGSRNLTKSDKNYIIVG